MFVDLSRYCAEENMLYSKKAFDIIQILYRYTLSGSPVMNVFAYDRVCPLTIECVLLL